MPFPIFAYQLLQLLHPLRFPQGTSLAAFKNLSYYALIEQKYSCMKPLFLANSSGQFGFSVFAATFCQWFCLSCNELNSVWSSCPPLDGIRTARLGICARYCERQVLILLSAGVCDLSAAREVPSCPRAQYSAHLDVAMGPIRTHGSHSDVAMGYKLPN